ncbi:MAG: phosphoglycerate kinase [bacterium]|nr:phosphoglycerate kinase [bacterium]
MNLPTPDKIDVKGKTVLLRLDLDVPIHEVGGKIEVAEDYRLRAAIPTIKHLIDNECSAVIVLGHRGRPGGKVVESLSLDPVGEYLEKLLEKEFGERAKNLNILMLANLRFDPGEEANSLEFAKSLAEKGDVYINEAFAASHREHASIVALPQLFKSKAKNSVAAGFHLAEEVRVLSGVLEGPKRPVVVLLGGGKIDKAQFVSRFLDHAEWVLVGGVLPKVVKSYCRGEDSGMCVAAAHLTPNGEDITPDSVRNFAEVIKDAGTIIWNGPMGDIDRGFWESTQAIAKIIAESSAFKVVGGGDTVHALQKFGLLDKMDYVSCGGGAMLEFLAYGDLPGLRALGEN